MVKLAKESIVYRTLRNINHRFKGYMFPSHNHVYAKTVFTLKCSLTMGP